MASQTLTAAMPDLDTDAPERQRTVLVWLILAFVGISVVMAPFTLWTARSAYITYPVALLVFTLIGLTLQVLGAIALFNLQASAVRIFALAFAVGVASGIYSVATVDPSDLVIPPGLDEATLLSFLRAGQIWGFVSGILFYGGTLLYLTRLRKRGILR